MNQGRLLILIDLFKEHTKSVSIITGSIITLFLLSQIKWGYDQAFEHITLRIILTLLSSIVVSILYFVLLIPALRKVTRMGTQELLNKLARVHMPIYLLWFYTIGYQLEVRLFTSYLLIIVPALCLVSLASLFIKYHLPANVLKQIPYLEISIFSSIIAITLSYFFYEARSGLENPMTGDVIKSLGISLLLVNLPFFFSFLRKAQSSVEQLPWYRSQAFITLLVLCTVTLAGFMIQEKSTYYFDTVFSTAGYLLFLFAALSYTYFAILNGQITKNAFFLFLFFAFSLWVTGIAWGSGYTWHAGSEYALFMNPFFVELISLGGAHIDTLFHASISHMIQTYGIPSTGLDGLLFYHYHFGSHWTFAQLSKLVQINPINFYQLCYPVIFLPLYFYSTLLFIMDLRTSHSVTKDSEQSLFSVPSFFIFAAVFISFLPTKLSYDIMGVGEYVNLVSQSQLMSLTLFFLSASLFLSFWKRFDATRLINKSDIIFLFLVTPFVIACIGLMKISVVTLVFIVVSYLFIRLGLFRYYQFTVSYLLSTAIFLIVFNLTKLSSQMSFGYFYNLKYGVASPWEPFHFMFQYFWSFAFIYFAITHYKISDSRQLKDAFTKRITVGMEVVIILCIAGFLPGALTTNLKVNAVYFSDVQKWVSVSFLLALFNYHNIKLQPAKVILILFLIPLTFVVYNNVKSEFLSYRTKTNTVKAKVLETPSAKFDILKLLQDLDQLPLSQKRNTLLFIPQNNRAYWGLADTIACYSVPFIAPALSGMAMIDGLPPAECREKNIKISREAGYECYKLRITEQTDLDRTNSSVCSKALEKGFRNIIRIEETEKGLQETNVPCECMP